jgi:hypothetical protein
MGIGREEDQIFLKMVEDAEASTFVCAECGKPLGYNPRGMMKPWHCVDPRPRPPHFSRCYSKWLRRYVKKNNLLK